MIGIEKVNQLKIFLMLIIILTVFMLTNTRAKAGEELARAQKAAEEGMRKASLSLQVKIMRNIIM